MKRFEYIRLLLIISFIIPSRFSFSQSKKEQISILTDRIDSMKIAHIEIHEYDQQRIATLNHMADSLRNALKNEKSQSQASIRSLKEEIEGLKKSIRIKNTQMAGRLGIPNELFDYLIERPLEENTSCELWKYFNLKYSPNEEAATESENAADEYPLGYNIINYINPIAFDSSGNLFVWEEHGVEDGSSNKIEFQIISPELDTPLYSFRLPFYTFPYGSLSYLSNDLNDITHDDDRFDHYYNRYEAWAMLCLETTKQLLLSQIYLDELPEKDRSGTQVIGSKINYQNCEIFIRDNVNENIELCLKRGNGRTRTIKSFPKECENPEYGSNCCKSIKSLKYIINPKNKKYIAVIMSIDWPCGFEGETDNIQFATVIDVNRY